MPEPRRHHFVPQLLLKGFAKKKSKVWQTHVFDKQDCRAFKASVENVMVAQDFYAMQLDTGVVSLEGFISRIESIAAPILQKLVKAETTAKLSDDDRENLALFVALQLIRGTGHRATFLNVATQFRKALIERGLSPDDIGFTIPDDDRIKLQALQAIATALPLYKEHLQCKDMMVFKAPDGHEFLIGDNPVTLDNHREFGFKGNIGLAVKGIEIYLPLSSHITLGMWATDLRTDIRAIVADVHRKQDALRASAMLGVGPARIAAQNALVGLDDKIADAERLLREVEAGGPVHSHPENMDRFNSMQICYAERYLASASGNFELARKMIDERPDLRTQGARMTVK